MDTGANEVIRPYNQEWWLEVVTGKAKGKYGTMKLAGNMTEYGAMTTYGEVMMKGGMNQGTHDIGWILPMARIQEELGMEARWKSDGSAVLMYPDGEEVKLVKDQELQFIRWEDFPSDRSCRKAI